MNLEVSHQSGILKGTVEVPLSKSILNRLLIAQAIGELPLYHPQSSDANDVHIIHSAITQIQRAIGTIAIDVKDAGTPLRFLTAFCAARPGLDVILTGSERLKERPMKALVDALISLGADITYMDKENYCPIRIKGNTIHGSSVTISSTESSQFVSALCLVAPSLPEGLHIHYNEDMVSFSYVQMTLFVLSKMGIQYTMSQLTISIKPQQYREATFGMGDWSGASFFYAAALLAAQSDFAISNLACASSQGDEKVVNLLTSFGVRTQTKVVGIYVQGAPSFKNEKMLIDMSETPDLAVPLIVCMACKFPTVSFTGIHHLRLKESDRILAIQSELAKLGIEWVYENGISLVRSKTELPSTAIINSHNDHRIAMGFAMLSLLGIKLTILGAECVSKSFPNFWNEITRLGFQVSED